MTTTLRGHHAVATAILAATLTACASPSVGRAVHREPTATPTASASAAPNRSGIGPAADAAVQDVVRALVADPGVSDEPWDSYALVVNYTPNSRGMSGFRYVGTAAAQPLTPEGTEAKAAIDELRAATQVEGRAPWDTCVVKIIKATDAFTIDYFYGADAESWWITPATIDAIGERARP